MAYPVTGRKPPHALMLADTSFPFIANTIMLLIRSFEFLLRLAFICPFWRLWSISEIPNPRDVVLEKAPILKASEVFVPGGQAAFAHPMQEFVDDQFEYLLRYFGDNDMLALAESVA